jgi:pyridoxal phosphate-dependent aminotransferase EpsN
MIYLSPPHLGTQEMVYLQAAITTNWVAPVGKNLLDFEQAICAFTQAQACVALNSGTAAIHLALAVLGVGVGDEVICPSFTFVATANPIIYQQARPIFVDSEAQTWNISPDLLEQAIRSRRQLGQHVKAMIVVHLYGNPAQMTDIQWISQKYEVPIIEDSAEALGAMYQNRALGTWGKLGIFSFNGNKIITTSAGGALISDDKTLIDRALYLATQAKDPAPHYQHSTIGYNYRLSNVLAGIGIGQMEVLPLRLQQRRKNFEFYQKNLPDRIFVAQMPPDSRGNHWLTCILLDDDAQRERLRLALQAQQIESRPVWKPLHLQPVFAHFPYFGGAIAQDLFARGLCLPSGSNLSSYDLEKIVATIQDTLKNA